MKNNIFPFSFSTATTFVKGYVRQDTNDYTQDDYYFRGGFKQLAVCEEKVAQLIGTEKNLIALTTSGMSAIATALDVVGLNSKDIIVHGATLYGQTYDYITVQLKEKEIIPVEIDTNNIAAIEKKLIETVKHYGKNAIKVIFVETIGNGSDMPILDIEKFLSLKIIHEINPIIIIDNTLPTTTVIPLVKYIEKSPLRIIGLESATKFYLFNQDIGGILFSNNDALIQLLKSRRRRIGVTPGPSLINTFQQLLPTKKQFDKANKIIMHNTLILAKACENAKGWRTKFDVIYPNLKNHPNYIYVNVNYFDGSAPVFFITSLRSDISSEKLLYQLEKLGAFKHTIYSESFGFDITGISYASRKGGYIRIAGGKESVEKTKQIGKQLQNALSQI